MHRSASAVSTLVKSSVVCPSHSQDIGDANTQAGVCQNQIRTEVSAVLRNCALGEWQIKLVLLWLYVRVPLIIFVARIWRSSGLDCSRLVSVHLFHYPRRPLEMLRLTFPFYKPTIRSRIKRTDYKTLYSNCKNC
jgi:hypothetical protein